VTMTACGCMLLNEVLKGNRTMQDANCRKT
jgi:hypothetical protein